MKRFKSTIIIFVIFIGLLSYYYLIESKKKKTDESAGVSIFTFKKEDITSLELTDLEENLNFLLKKDKDWKIEKPKELPVSKKTLDGILSELAVLKADRKITEEIKRLKPYGLDVPKYKVKFTIGRDDSHTLLVGKLNPTGNFYFVREEGKNNIYTVDNYKVNKFIKKNLFDLRDKELLALNEDEISKVEIKIKDKPEFSLEKDKDKKWVFKNHSGPDLTQDIQNVIDELKNLSVEEFMDDSNLSPKNYGLGNPSYIVKIYKGQTESSAFQFGKKEGNSIYVKRNKEDMFYRVGKRLVDSIENLSTRMEKKDTETKKSSEHGMGMH